MEIIIASIISILLVVVVGMLVYWIMRQRITHIQQQLYVSEQALEKEKVRSQEVKLLLTQK